MGPAGGLCLGCDGPAYDHGAGGLWNLLRSRGRGSSGSVELSVSVYPDRVLRNDAGIQPDEFFHGNAGSECECSASGWTAFGGMAALPGAADQLSGSEWRCHVWRLHGAGGEFDAEPVCAGSSAALL